MAVKGGEHLGAKLREIGRRLSAGELQVGFMENADPYPDGTPVALVAAVQEFGSPSNGIPPRPFMRPAVAEKSKAWARELGVELAKSNLNATTALGQVGLMMEGDIRDAIQEVQSPALSPVTLLLRQRFGNQSQEVKFSDVQQARADIAAGKTPKVTPTQGKPLVWTGHLLKSVSSRVKGEE